MFPHTIIAHATYLNDIFEKHRAHTLLVNYNEDTQDLYTLISQITEYKSAALNDTQQVMLFLRQQKQLFSLLWSAHYLQNHLEQTQAGKLQSEFAQATINLAFKAACACADFRKFQNPQTHIIPGIFVLGLGKLGGYDLNFSSDVDLIAFYDTDTITIDERLGRTHVVSNLLTKMTYILNHMLDSTFVWRVDWRLRPNASIKYLSMPAHQAINFYFFQSMPWHRLAMIKARIVAGDVQAGELFLDNIKNYLWKRNLDYRAIDEIASLKQRINAEHPRLQKQRTANKDNSLNNLDGFNFKLGHGGIREIEFLINAMQLIWGGKKENLRNTHTLSTLQALIKENLIAADLGAQLKEAYMFMRRSEDALQMLHNQQTHTTPSNIADKTLWLNLLDTHEQEYSAQLTTYRKITAQEFNNLFSDEQQSPEDDFDWDGFKQNLNDSSTSIINDWQQGFLIYGALPSQARPLSKLATLLAKTIQESHLEFDAAIAKVDTYLRQLPSGSQYLSLLQKQPQLLNQLIAPLLLSSAMSSLLEQSPHIIDCFLEHQTTTDYSPQIDRDYILNEKDHEQALEKFRRLINEQLYRQYLFYIENKISSAQLEKHLTQQAQETLQLALDLTHAYLKIENSSFSIIGLGKLGMKTLMPLSDLDLMYLFDETLSINQANKIASHLNTVLHTRMREGRVYEVDTRLRPSGRSGSPTISLASFENYHQTQAFNWEHLALFPARYICGLNSTGEKFSQIRINTLSQQRNNQQWRNDAFKMFERIREQRIHKDNGFAFSAKLRNGGLMQAEYLLACYGVETAQKNSALLSVDYLDSIAHIEPLQQLNFLDSLNFWRALQITIRIFGYENTAIEQLPEFIQSVVLRHLDIANLKELNEKINYHSEKIQNMSSEYFSTIDQNNIKDWKETSVIWGV